MHVDAKMLKVAVEVLMSSFGRFLLFSMTPFLYNEFHAEIVLDLNELIFD